jgi:hypothetical protein
MITINYVFRYKKLTHQKNQFLSHEWVRINMNIDHGITNYERNHCKGEHKVRPYNGFGHWIDSGFW